MSGISWTKILNRFNAELLCYGINKAPKNENQDLYPNRYMLKMFESLAKIDETSEEEYNNNFFVVKM